MLSLILPVLIGSGLGAALGYFGQCSSGTCPLTATWWRGALYGGAMGLMFYFISGRNSAAAAKETKNVSLIKEAEFDAQVLQSKLPVVVDFYAPWCGPCRKLSPMLDEMAGPLADKIKFVKINLDEAPQLAQRYKIEAVPTLMFFQDGKVIDTVVGLPSEEQLKGRLNLLVKTEERNKSPQSQ